MLMHPRFHTGQSKRKTCPKVSLGISQNKMPFQRDSQHLVQFSEESRLSRHFSGIAGVSAPFLEGQKLASFE